MNWVPHVDYVEAEPFDRRATKKKYWDDGKKEWHEYTQWTVAYTKQLENWLVDTYGPPTFIGPGQVGKWARIFDKIILDEQTYLFYCLKFKDY